MLGGDLVTEVVDLTEATWKSLGLSMIWLLRLEIPNLQVRESHDDDDDDDDDASTKWFGLPFHRMVSVGFDLISLYLFASSNEAFPRADVPPASAGVWHKRPLWQRCF